MDYDTLSHADLIIVKLIKAIRGDRSQNSLSHSLGFNENRVNRWEKLQRPIYWDSFIDLCNISNIPLEEILKDVFRYRGAPENFAGFVSFLCQSWNKKDLSDKIHSSVQTITRWQTGESVPTLKKIFYLIHFTQGMLPEFLYKLCPNKNAPNEIQEMYRKKVELKKFFCAYPEVSSVLRCFELHTYQKLNAHSDSFIAKELNIPLERVETIIEGLSYLQLITPNKELKYRVSQKGKRVNTYSMGKEVLNRHKQYYIQKASERVLEQDINEEIFGYLVYSSSPQLRQEIYEKCRNFHQEIIAIIHNSKSKEEHLDSIEILNIQAFHASPSKKGS